MSQLQRKVLFPTPVYFKDIPNAKNLNKYLFKHIKAWRKAEPKGEIKTKTNKEMVNVFVPTTPNPTSGFLLLFPVEDVVELDMSVEDAIKLVVSAGLVIPNE